MVSSEKYMEHQRCISCGKIYPLEDFIVTHKKSKLEKADNEIEYDTVCKKCKTKNILGNLQDDIDALYDLMRAGEHAVSQKTAENLKKENIQLGQRRPDKLPEVDNQSEIGLESHPLLQAMDGGPLTADALLNPELLNSIMQEFDKLSNAAQERLVMNPKLNPSLSEVLRSQMKKTPAPKPSPIG